MLTSVVILSSVFLFIIAPVLTVLRYYKPAQLTLLVNIGLIILTVVTWPLVPIVVATQKRDTFILSMFWVALLIWLVAGAYWITLNVDQFIQLQEQFVM